MDGVYKTSDQGFAGYLLDKGFYCVKAVPSNSADPRRKDFIFVDVPNPRELEDNYFRYKKELISARALNEKVKTANRIAKQGLSEAEMEQLRGE